MTRHEVPRGLADVPLNRYLKRAWPMLPGFVLRDILKKRDVRRSGVRLSAEDTVGNVRVVRYTAATSRVTLHLRAGGMGAAFGKYAEQEALECVWPAVFYGDVAVSGALTVNGQTVEAMLFPVGSVRLTDSPAAPETPAGAVWESVETGIAGVYGWRRTT